MMNTAVFAGARRAARGFTLIELLVVIVILGLLTSLVGPRLFGHLASSKSKAARAQIELLGSTLDGFRLDVGRYPTTAEGIAALSVRPESVDATVWRGPYLKKPVEKDPWGNPYVYLAPGEHGDYDLSALGADATPGGEGENADVLGWE
jgi:general secretion pathway protein G